MAAAPKTNLGKIPCPVCGDAVALKKSATGKLSYACQHADCEATGFADQSSGAARKWLAKLPAATPTPPAPTPAPIKTTPAAKTPTAPAPTPAAPPPKPPRPAFSLDGL